MARRLEVQARVALDGTGFQAGVRKIEATVAKLRSQLGRQLGSTLAATFGTAAIAQGVRGAVEFASQIEDTSVKLGISKQALQVLGYQATQTGSSLEAIANTMKKVAVNQQEALGGNKEMVESFAGLGVSMNDLRSKNFEQLFKQIQDRIAGSVVSGRQLADVTKVFGKAGADILPALKLGFTETEDKLKSMGAILSDETISRMDELGDRFDDLKLQSLEPLANIGEGFLEMAKIINMGVMGLKNFSQALGEASVAGLGPAAKVDESNFTEKGLAFFKEKEEERALAAAEKRMESEATKQIEVAKETTQALSAEEQTRQAKITAERKKAAASRPDKEKPGLDQSAGSNQLQRIGAFAPSVNLLSEAKKHTNFLMKINEGINRLENIKGNIGQSPFGDFA